MDIQEVLNLPDECVYIKSGEYRIDRPLTINGNKKTIIGERVVILPTRSFPIGQPLLIAQGSNHNSKKTRVTIIGVELNGDNKEVVGFFSDFTFHLSLVRMWVTNINGNGLMIGNSDDLLIDNCDVRNCGKVDASGQAVYLYADPPPVPGNAPNHPGTNTVHILGRTIIERYRGIALRAENQTLFFLDHVKFHGLNEDRDKSKSSLVMYNSDRIRINNCHSTLAKDEDYKFYNCKDVQITGQTASQGRDIKIFNDAKV